MSGLGGEEWGETEREAVKSVCRNVPGQAWVDTTQMTVRESLAEGRRGTPINTPSSPLPPSLPLYFSFLLSLPSSMPAFVPSVGAADRLSVIKTLHKYGRQSCGERAHVHTGGAWKTARHISAAFGIEQNSECFHLRSKRVDFYGQIDTGQDFVSLQNSPVC